MLMPTTPIPAPELEPLMADKSLFHKVNLMTLRNTTLGNIFNLPGVAMPMNSARMNSARMKDQRPTSLLVSTHAGRDDQLIEVARICEDILNRGES